MTPPAFNEFDDASLDPPPPRRSRYSPVRIVIGLSVLSLLVYGAFSTPGVITRWRETKQQVQLTTLAPEPAAQATVTSAPRSVVRTPMPTATAATAPEITKPPVRVLEPVRQSSATSTPMRAAEPPQDSLQKLTVERLSRTNEKLAADVKDRDEEIRTLRKQLTAKAEEKPKAVATNDRRKQPARTTIGKVVTAPISPEDAAFLKSLQAKKVIKR